MALKYCRSWFAKLNWLNAARSMTCDRFSSAGVVAGAALMRVARAPMRMVEAFIFFLVGWGKGGFG